MMDGWNDLFLFYSDSLNGVIKGHNNYLLIGRLGLLNIFLNFSSASSRTQLFVPHLPSLM
jgi:hypothetical protein